MYLRKYLRKRGIKIIFFATELGICRATLYNYMTGVQIIPKSTRLAVLQLTNGKVKEIEDYGVEKIV